MFKHALHERPMFDDEGLARLLDLYPRDKLGVFTMGEDPKAWTTWRKGSAGNLTGDQLLEAAKSGRIWLNLRQTNDHVPEYAALSDEIFADKEGHVPGLKTFKRDVGMLISSANAQVFYHLDVPLVSLWQIRGEKKVWVYPVADPYVGDLALEKIVLRETAEQFAFEPEWDKGAQEVDADARQHGHLEAERPAPDRERPDAERLDLDRIHDSARPDAGQCHLRQRRAAPAHGHEPARAGRLWAHGARQAGRGARGQGPGPADPARAPPAGHLRPGCRATGRFG
jgi:hypothetical protein